MGPLALAPARRGRARSSRSSRPDTGRRRADSASGTGPSLRGDGGSGGARWSGAPRADWLVVSLGVWPTMDRPMLVLMRSMDDFDFGRSSSAEAWLRIVDCSFVKLDFALS